MSIIERLRAETGSALLITILILSSLLVVGLSAASIAFSGTMISGVQQRSTVALYAAEAGAERSLWEARKNDWATTSASSTNIFGTTTLSNAAFYNTDYASSSLQFYFTSQGTYREAVRAVELSMDSTASSTPPPPPPPPGNWLSDASCAGLEVYDKDGPGGNAYQWKVVADAINGPCVQPQCTQDGPVEGNMLVSDNSVDFSQYPARDYCKSIGGRLPSLAELICILANKDAFGDPLNDSDDYWSGRESNFYNDAYSQGYYGTPNMTVKTIVHRVRCVR